MGKREDGKAGWLSEHLPISVTPAKAGVHEVLCLWQLIRRFELVDPCLRRDDESCYNPPAEGHDMIFSKTLKKACHAYL